MHFGAGCLGRMWPYYPKLWQIFSVDFRGISFYFRYIGVSSYGSHRNHCVHAYQQSDQTLSASVHNNVRIEQDSTRLEVCINFRNTMLMLLFQLIIRIIMLIIFIQIFYLCVLCLPLKRLSQAVVLSFTQMSCFNIYVPLLLRLANDVEENPEPTVYDVVDPSKTMSADFSKGNARIFGQNAGKQCVAMFLTSIVHSHLTNVNAWDFSFLNFMLRAGNSLYTCISSSINKDFLLLTDVPEMASVSDKIYLQYSVIHVVVICL